MARFQRLVAFFGVLLVASCSDSGGNAPSGRSQAKLTDVTITMTQNNQTSEWKNTVSYGSDPSQLTSIATTLGGNAMGHVDFTYQQDLISDLKIVNSNGQATDSQISYDAQHRISNMIDTSGNIVVSKSEFKYDDTKGGIWTQWVRTTGSTVVTLDLTYDVNGRLTTLASSGADQTKIEIQYNALGKPQQINSSAKGTPMDTYTYSYNPMGLLDVVLHSQDANQISHYQLSYNPDGTVSKLDWMQGTTSMSAAYSYAPGAVEGFTFAPDIPYAQMFDLKGFAFTHYDVLESGVGQLTASLLKTDGNGGSGGGGGGGSGGGGGMCAGIPATNACEMCLAANCCDEVNACLADADCTALLQCAQACGSSNQTCLQGCVQMHPGGLSHAQSAAQCEQAHCSSQCAAGGM